jgi:hypothetical protein
MAAAAVAEGKQLYITLVGGGNSTHCFAPLACAQGHKVAILTRKPEAWADTVAVRLAVETELEGTKRWGLVYKWVATG